MQFVSAKGAHLPALGLGTWSLSGRACYESVRAALDIGYRHIDTAELYGNEAEIGAAVRDSRVPRGEVFVTTKVPMGELRAPQVRRNVEQSLKRLATDYVDLLLIHWPSRSEPLAETLGAFAEAKAKGQTRFIGVSNFTVALLHEAIAKHGADIVCNQVEYHPYLSQRPVLAALAQYELVLTAYSPLARGRVVADRDLARIGKAYGKTPSQVALRWLLDQPNVAAVPKSASRIHLAADFAIFDFTLSAADRAIIDAKRGATRLVDPAGWAPDWDPA
ncbi:MAG: aldo/keto reductase [Alphaproteobacteria bacterium]|nr:aldo/keto reductase [Alphaproteobacteria bacterium]